MGHSYMAGTNTRENPGFLYDDRFLNHPPYPNIQPGSYGRSMAYSPPDRYGPQSAPYGFETPLLVSVSCYILLTFTMFFSWIVVVFFLLKIIIIIIIILLLLGLKMLYSFAKELN